MNPDLQSLLVRVREGTTTVGDAERMACLIEERDEQRQRAERAETNAVALRETLSDVAYRPMDTHDNMEAHDRAIRVLAKPHPGAALLEELERLRAIIPFIRASDGEEHRKALEHERQTLWNTLRRISSALAEHGARPATETDVGDVLSAVDRLAVRARMAAADVAYAKAFEIWGDAVRARQVADAVMEPKPEDPS